MDASASAIAGHLIVSSFRTQCKNGITFYALALAFELNNRECDDAEQVRNEIKCIIAFGELKSKQNCELQCECECISCVCVSNELAHFVAVLVRPHLSRTKM